MQTVIIDNYDSFTYNLVHLVYDVTGREPDVVKNDGFNMDDLRKYEHIILSPGPGIPDEAGLLKDVIRTYGASKKILGVCLGLQAIGEVYGGSLLNLNKVFHGMKTTIFKTGTDDPILSGVPDQFEAGRYHSWVINKKSVPESLLVTATDAEGEIMATRHVSLHVYGVQFHPESIMTPEGNRMLANFLNL